jgi:hypothetical protein
MIMQKKFMAVPLLLVWIILGTWCLSQSGDKKSQAAATPQTGELQNGAGPVLAQAPEKETPATGAAPKISLPEVSFDFGHVNQGDKVTHKFVVKNIGDAPLTLIKAKGS